MAKIAFIGVGSLGSCIAFECAANGLAEQIVFIDTNQRLAEGQAADIVQSACLENDVEVMAGDYSDLAGSDIAVISAGRPRTPEIKTRLELAQVNYPIIKSISERLKGFGGVVITLTNPMDICNYFAWKFSGLERERVIGSGSLLDTTRFRALLSHMFKCPPSHVSAQVIGEHGDSQVPLFSRVRIAGERKEFDTAQRENITMQLLTRAMEVIAKKGSTIYAPARSTYCMIENVLRGKGGSICSVVLEGEYGQRGVSIGAPVELGNKGVEKVKELALDPWEKARFEKGAAVLKGEIARL